MQSYGFASLSLRVEQFSLLSLSFTPKIFSARREVPISRTSLRSLKCDRACIARARLTIFPRTLYRGRIKSVAAESPIFWLNCRRLFSAAHYPEFIPRIIKMKEAGLRDSLCGIHETYLKPHGSRHKWRSTALPPFP